MPSAHQLGIIGARKLSSTLIASWRISGIIHRWRAVWRHRPHLIIASTRVARIGIKHQRAAGISRHRDIMRVAAARAAARLIASARQHDVNNAASASRHKAALIGKSASLYRRTA